MPIPFSCQTCGRELRVKDELAGQEIYCPDCKSILTVPGALVGEEALPQYPSESSSQFSEQERAPTPIPYAELAADAHLPPKPAAEELDADDDEAPVVRRQSMTAGPNIGKIIGGLALMLGALVLVVVGLTARIWFIRGIVILAIAGIATFFRGLFGSNSN